MARFALFIDGGYLDKLCELHFAGLRISFERLPLEVTRVVNESTSEPLDLVRTLYYHCPPYQSEPPTAEERQRTANFRRFADRLKYIDNFDFREGRLALRGYDKTSGEPIFQQKRIDLLMGLDFALLSAKQRVTHIGLLAGDSDLVPAVQIAKQEGVVTWLFHGPRFTYSQELWQEVDKRYELAQAFMEAVRR
jgi:uncharacterized LabA/DUF88 family protein